MKENKKSKSNSVNELIEAWSYGHVGSRVTPRLDLIQVINMNKEKIKNPYENTGVIYTNSRKGKSIL